MARSRRPRAVSAGGAASRRPTSALFRKCGSLRSSFGPRSPSAGFFSSAPGGRGTGTRSGRPRSGGRSWSGRTPGRAARPGRPAAGGSLTWSGPDAGAGPLPEEGDRLGQVLAVGLDRVRGRVLLEAQVPEEVGQGLVHRGVSGCGSSARRGRPASCPGRRARSASTAASYQDRLRAGSAAWARIAATSSSRLASSYTYTNRSLPRIRARTLSSWGTTGLVGHRRPARAAARPGVLSPSSPGDRELRPAGRIPRRRSAAGDGSSQ